MITQLSWTWLLFLTKWNWIWKLEKKSPSEVIQSTNHADNNSVASSQYRKEDICIYIACFLVELYLEFLKFEPKLQTHFMFTHLVRKESYLSFSVFIFFLPCYCLYCFTWSMQNSGVPMGWNIIFWDKLLFFGVGGANWQVKYDHCLLIIVCVHVVCVCMSVYV